VTLSGRDTVDDDALAANPRRRFSKRNRNVFNRPGVVDDHVASVQRITRTLGIDETHNSVTGEYWHGVVSNHSFWCWYVRFEAVREVEQPV
jgi:argonaute-like protein implicated in RNA metabolism and viral defense